MVDEQDPNTFRDVSFEPNPINVTTRRSNTPVIEEYDVYAHIRSVILHIIVTTRYDATSLGNV